MGPVRLDRQPRRAHAHGLRNAVPAGHVHRCERIQAIDFTLEHDDGLGLDTLEDADVVLTGVSRTGKTPTAIYLAQQGYRVANVSLAMKLDPPAQLLALPPHKVIALVVEPGQLASIRSCRQTSWRMRLNSYSDHGHVTREVDWSKRLFARRGWRILDVTDRAIEETAARITGLIPNARHESLSAASPPAKGNRLCRP